MKTRQIEERQIPGVTPLSWPALEFSAKPALVLKGQLKAPEFV
jgi:hypothetical protein